MRDHLAVPPFRERFVVNRSVLLFLLFLASAGSVMAESRPPLVVDMADLMGPEQEYELNTVFQEVYARRQAPIMLITIPSKADRDAERLEDLAEFIFVGSALNDPDASLRNWGYGVMFMVARDDRDAAIHLSGKWSELHRQFIRAVLEEQVRPVVAEGRFAEGIAIGSAAIMRLTEDITTRHDPYWELFLHVEMSSLRQLFLALTSFSAENVLLYMAAVYGVILLLEHFFPWRKDQPKRRPMLALDVFYTIMNYVLYWGILGTALATVCTVAFNDLLQFTLRTTNLVAIQLESLPVWLRVLLALLYTEFNGYWVHRALHGSDFLWEIHKVHHSALHLDVFNAARLHLLEPITYRTLTYVPAVMVGFGVDEVFLVGLVRTFFCTFTHANCRIRLGPLKYIINSPELHIWHHARGTHERGNCNFGGFLSVFDFIFGTAYVPEELNPSPPMAFDGVEDYPTGYLTQFMAPFAGMVSLAKRRLGRRFGPSRKGHTKLRREPAG